MLKKIRPQDMPLKVKLMAVTLSVAVLISIVSTLGFRMVVAKSNEMIYTQTALSLSVLSDKIAARLNSIMEASLLAATNRSLQENLKHVTGSEISPARANARSGITEALHNYIQADIINISVLPRGDVPVNWGYDASPEAEEILNEALADATEAQGVAIWRPTGRPDGSILCLREIRCVTTPFLDHLGYLVIRVNLDRIMRETSREVLSISDYQINIYQNDDLVYPAQDSGEAWLPRMEARVDRSAYAIEAVDGAMSFLVYSPIHAFRLRWELVLGLSYEAVFRALIAANTSFFIAVALAVLTGTVLSFFMFNGINRHLKLLEAKMDRVRAGDLQPLGSNLRLAGDELGRLNIHFDEMREAFRKVIEDNYIKELLLTQTQLKALEQQINPHFLYNSLESVRWFARRGDSDSIAVIIGALSKLLRSALSTGEDKITLEKELQILNSYLSIQRIRYSETLALHIDVEDAALPVLIPKMSIQPLVENAIIHGLEENIDRCNIYIRAWVKGGKVRVEVENDGSEIEENILALLREKQVKAGGSGVGLLNIDKRLTLLFGQGHGLHFNSGRDRVIVWYEIPIEIGGDDHAETLDRRG